MAKNIVIKISAVAINQSSIMKYKYTKRKSPNGKGNETRIVERQRVTLPNDVTEQQKLMHFINNFSFPNPDWNVLPADFPNISKTGLTKEEGHLLDGIKLAWLSSKGKAYFIKITARRTFVVATIIFVLLAGRNIITGSHTTSKTVSAKTVSQVVGEAVQATMSAVFRK